MLLSPHTFCIISCHALVIFTNLFIHHFWTRKSDWTHTYGRASYDVKSSLWFVIQQPCTHTEAQIHVRLVWLAFKQRAHTHTRTQKRRSERRPLSAGGLTLAYYLFFCVCLAGAVRCKQPMQSVLKCINMGTCVCMCVGEIHKRVLYTRLCFPYTVWVL